MLLDEEGFLEGLGHWKKNFQPQHDEFEKDWVALAWWIHSLPNKIGNKEGMFNS